jgi:hypothetical protein
MSGSRAREVALAAAFFLLATAVLTWPIVPRAADGLADIWDAKLNAWILHWDFHQIFRDPLHLFDANIFHPDRYALAFSENLLGASVFAFPLYAAGVSTLAAYNVVFLLGMFLSAMAAWALAREVTGDPLAASVAGLVYAFCPFRLAQIPHIQHQWGAFLALTLLFLLRYLDEGRRRDLVLFGACLAWNALCNVHYAIFSGLLIALVLAWRGVAAGWRVFRPRLAGVAMAAAAAAIVLVPLFAPYRAASKLYGMERGYGEIDFYSANWGAFLNPGAQNKLYKPLAKKFEKPEGELFPGFAAVALAAAALTKRRRTGDGSPADASVSMRRRRLGSSMDVLIGIVLVVWIIALAGRKNIGPLNVADPGRVQFILTALVLVRLAAAFPRWSRRADLGDFLRRLRIGTTPGLFLAIAVLGIVVALGTHTPYYRFLVQSLGAVFRAIRAPSRGVVLLDLALGVLAALAVAGWSASKRSGARLAITAAALLVISLEYRAFPVEVTPTDPAPRPVDRWLAGISLAGGVVEWPLGNWFDQDYEFRSTAHWKKLVNGSSGFAPKSYEELAASLEKRPIPETVWEMLAKRQATVLVFHPGVGEGETPAAYGKAIAAAAAAGRIAPKRSFAHGNHRDVVFVFADRPEAALAAADPKPEETRRTLAGLTPSRLPFGYLDVPGEGAAVASGSWSFGWALDDSGIAEVLVSADGGPPLAASLGEAHAGVAQAYPGFPGLEKPGFAFSLPALAPGPHTLTLTLVARDGGRSTLSRNFVVK